nr:MAG TPA: hypothetical protein [Caudoviricetes sp.]
MEYITFKQFIYTIGIRDCYTSPITGATIDDGLSIRVYYGRGYDKYDYIDISWYDYSLKKDAWKTLEKYFKKEILESIVTSFFFNQDLCCIEVYTCAKGDVEENLEEYKN